MQIAHPLRALARGEMGRKKDAEREGSRFREGEGRSNRYGKACRNWGAKAIDAERPVEIGGKSNSCGKACRNWGQKQ
eukprot:5942577-Pleurochrysis_carterae.AAC.1